MQWLRRITLIFAVGIGVAVVALVAHTFWSVSRIDSQLLTQRVQDLQLLVLILLGLAGLYTVVFLLAPNMSERILRNQAEVTVKAVRTQLAIAVEDLRELKEEMRQMMREQSKLIREIRMDVVAAAHPPTQDLAPPAIPIPQPASAVPALNGREYLQLSGRLRVLSNELVQIYQALATLSAPKDDETAKSYLNQALGLTTDPFVSAEIHYALACLLGRNGELAEATAELQTAFLSKTHELEENLARDTEEGGPLYALAVTTPHEELINELLMNVSVGA